MTWAFKLIVFIIPAFSSRKI